MSKVITLVIDLIGQLHVHCDVIGRLSVKP